MRQPTKITDLFPRNSFASGMLRLLAPYFPTFSSTRASSCEIPYFKCTYLNVICCPSRSHFESSHQEVSKCTYEHFYAGNIFISTIRYFDVANFTTVTTLTLHFSCKMSFLTVGLKISSLPCFSLTL